MLVLFIARKRLTPCPITSYSEDSPQPLYAFLKRAQDACFCSLVDPTKAQTKDLTAESGSCHCFAIH